MFYLGIDWSGAKAYTGDPVQLALASDGEAEAAVIPPPDGHRRWTRTLVADAVRTLYAELRCTDERAIVGFDFSFAFPCVDKGCYFPGAETALPPDARALWAHVDDVAREDDDCFAGAFCRRPPYQRFFLQSPGLRGASYEPRLRVTESCCRSEYGLAPQSNFHLIGPRTVGIGACAGMRWLHGMREERRRGGIDFCIWPFESLRPDTRLVFVEVYPRLCRLLLGNSEMPREMPAHQRDALFAAVGMQHIARRPDCWDVSAVPPETIASEGWIFGV